MSLIDQWVTSFDRSLRVLSNGANAKRSVPGADLPEPTLSDAERQLAGSLMRVNHVGEVCAQALYQGQALGTRNQTLRKTFEAAAEEELDHLGWSAERLQQLGARQSLLNPLWYTGSLALGWLAGRASDRLGLGFIAETERQVERHLSGHLERLPERDLKSRAIVEQMRLEESAHGATATELGAAPLPEAARFGMKMTSKLMTTVAYWI